MNARRAAAATALACAAAVVPVTVASAAPSSNGCPNAYDLVSVSALAELGYHVPGMVDDPTSGVKSFGHPGNGDGWVCSVPLGNQTSPAGLQFYNFWDNTLHS
jgi:hypothetical protein